MVLPGFDQQGYLGDSRAPEEVHCTAFAGNIVEQVQPLRSSLRKTLTNSKSPSGKPSHRRQLCTAFANFGEPRQSRSSSTAIASAAYDWHRDCHRGVCGAPTGTADKNCEGGTMLRRLDCGAESRMEESAAIDQD